MSEAPAHSTHRADGAPLLTRAWGLLIFGPIFLLGNEVGNLLRYPVIGSAVLFPPYAILTAALVLTPRRDWIWYLLLGTITHTAASWPEWNLTWVLGAEVANVTRALVAASLLRALFVGPPRLDGIPALLRFVAGAVLIAPALAAMVGAANVVTHGASTSYWTAWLQWFLSNALTGLTMLPMCLAAIVRAAGLRRRSVDRRRALEATLLATCLVITCTFLFLAPGRNQWEPPLPMYYLPLPFLIWAALRFGPGGASVALSVVTVAAIWGVDRGTGPFLTASRSDNLLALQLFVLLTAIPVFCIAAVSSARHGAVQLYRALLTSLHDQVAILDARGKVLEVNDSWRRHADAVDALPIDRVRAGDDYLATCRAAAAQGDAIAARALDGIDRVLGRRSQLVEMEYDHESDGRQEWYVLRLERLERPDGGAVLTRASVSARRRAQSEIEEQRHALSHLARVALLGELTGTLAHELRQPLMSILANAEAAQSLLRRPAVDLEEVREIVRDIIASDRRAGEVVNRLRSLLRRGEVRLQEVDANELVREALDVAHGELVARRVKATVSVSPDLPAVFGDRVQLLQVLLNLILNACEAMSATAETGRTLVVTVRRSTDGQVQFSIRDSGPGIPPALTDRLFEPFVTTKSEGLGLGLSISRTIVAAHSGQLWAENNADGGATLHCVLAPAAAAAPAATQPEPAPRADDLPAPVSARQGVEILD